MEDHPFAERKAAVSDLEVDPMGRVWVLARRTHPGPDRLDVYSPRGRYLGSLEDVPIPMAFALDGSALLRRSSDDSMDQFTVVSLRMPDDEGGPE
ncbi:MAG: hypothetical protein R6W82_00425 [bacterium]